ncbi:AAA family ATPase [Mangrovibrevibacter kandeliae]|uniref:AAA family ATPase n=1 Tax=Mangrovibrevibacter kandeliae TaxID=2968473 RepID=UPI0021191A03|nr:AAA family ATPase [Aurantimonas sp. CSK15Z-1]MCQ8782914.1 AAA family ATPase [Aurantimonas sp. CSK15Z-1]
MAPPATSGPSHDLPVLSALPVLPALPLLATAPVATKGDAGNVAALLLIERALRHGGVDPAELERLCRGPGAIVAIRADVDGFAETARRLVESGAVLPGRVETVELTRIRLSTSLHFPGSEHLDWSVLTMTLDRTGLIVLDARTSGGREDAIGGHLAFAARSGHPLIVLSQPEIPPLLRLAAHHCLDGGRLDAAIVAQTIAVVTGHALEVVEDALAPLEGDEVELALLGLADLSLAVRAGLPLDQVMALLTQLGQRATAAARARAAEAESGDDDDEDDEDDEGDEDLGAGQSRGRGEGEARSSKPTGAKTSKGGTSRTSGSSDHRRDDRGDAGSTVIEPEPSSSDARVTVERLAGYGKAKDWALDLKADLDLWRTGEIAWDTMSTRLLLSGPPGTGKTTFARALCNTLELPLHVASVQVWLEPGYLGSVLGRMSAAFAAAEAAAPVILFIDEADAIGRRQPDTKDYADYWNAIVNRMLELMDGAVRTEGVIVVGATNRPEALDAALTRSGRWETEIVVPKPDRATLAAIIAHHLGPDLERLVAEDEGADPASADGATSTARLLDRLSRQAVGRTGADIERLLREARGRARREKRSVNLADLETALGAGKPQRSPQLRRRLAVHEAGHAVLRHALKLGTLLDLSIEDEEGGYAVTCLDLGVEQDEGWMMAHLAALLGGRAAEALVFGTVTGGSGGDGSSDLAQATQLALAMETEFGFGRERPLTHRPIAMAQSLLLRPGPLAEAVEARLEAASDLARTTLAAHRGLLERLALALGRAGSLDAGEIEAIFKATPDAMPVAVAEAATAGPPQPDGGGADGGPMGTSHCNAVDGETVITRTEAAAPSKWEGDGEAVGTGIEASMPSDGLGDTEASAASQPRRRGGARQAAAVRRSGTGWAEREDA